jgi:hypothetical protein
VGERPAMTYTPGLARPPPLRSLIGFMLAIL